MIKSNKYTAIIHSSLLIAAICCCISCSNPAKDELILYVNERMVLVAKSFDSFMDSGDLSVILKKNSCSYIGTSILSRHSDALQIISNTSPSSPDLKIVHELLLRSVLAKIAALVDLEKACKAENQFAIKNALKKFDAGRDLALLFRRNLEEFAKTQGVSLSF